MAEQGTGAYTRNVYLSVTDDANRWRSGAPHAHLPNESKVSQLMSSGQGLAIEKNLAKYDVKVLAAETRKQALLKDLGIGPKTNFVVYIIRVGRIRDGASCVTAQRYSALRNLYNNLKSNGQVRSEGAPEFPGKRVVTEESFKGDRADVSSDFVRQRKEQLGSFLRQLFNKNPDLWDNPEVQEFFNLDSMNQGKSYAERAHSMAGHGLRHYDPTNPSQWNPYSIAMQAAEQNRNRNADFTSTNSTSNPSWRPPDGAGAGEAAEGGSNEAEEDRGKKGIGAWFRGLTGGVGAAENGGVGGVTGTASAGRGGGWWGNGEARGGGGGNGEVGKLSSPAAAQVKALVEMGFEEDAALECLKASGYDTNLAAEYCVAGIPSGRAASARPPSPSPTANGAQRRRAKTVIGNNVVPSSSSTSGGGLAASSAWRRGAYDPFGATVPGGRSTIGSNGSVAGSTYGTGFSSGWSANTSSGVGVGTLDWRSMPRSTGAGRDETGSSSAMGGGSGVGGGGTVDV